MRLTVVTPETVSVFLATEKLRVVLEPTAAVASS